MIKAVIFDIDGVLLDSFEANFKFYSDLMKKFGYPLPTREDFKKIFHRTMEDVVKILTNGDEKEVKKIWEAAKNREIPYPHNLLVVPEKLSETLEIFKKDYQLGIVTSRVKVNLYENPVLKSIIKYFPIIIGYEDTKKYKPDPEPLLLAAQKLNLKPEECVYIGDVEHHDVKAAKAAGMKSILFSKNISIDADAHTSIFSELPSLIKKL